MCGENNDCVKNKVWGPKNLHYYRYLRQTPIYISQTDRHRIPPYFSSNVLAIMAECMRLLFSSRMRPGRIM